MTSTLKMVEHCYKKIQKSYINEKIKIKDFVQQKKYCQKFHSSQNNFQVQWSSSQNFVLGISQKGTQFLKRMELEDFLFNFMTYYKGYSNQNSVVSA